MSANTKVVRLNSITSGTWLTIPTTPPNIASDNTTVKEIAKESIVATDGSSADVINVNKDSNFAKNELNRK